MAVAKSTVGGFKGSTLRLEEPLEEHFYLNLSGTSSSFGEDLAVDAEMVEGLAMMPSSSAH